MEKMSYDYYICNLSVTPFRRTKDPVIKEVVCNGNSNYSCVLESLEEAMKDVLLQQYPAAELEEGDD